MCKNMVCHVIIVLMVLYPAQIVFGDCCLICDNQGISSNQQMELVLGGDDYPNKKFNDSFFKSQESSNKYLTLSIITGTAAIGFMGLGIWANSRGNNAYDYYQNSATSSVAGHNWNIVSKYDNIRLGSYISSGAMVILATVFYKKYSDSKERLNPFFFNKLKLEPDLLKREVRLSFHF